MSRSLKQEITPSNMPTLQEALDTDHSAYVDYIKSHMSVKDGERLGILIITLKFHAEHSVIPGFHRNFDYDKVVEQIIKQMKKYQ